MRRRDQRGVVFPSPVVILSVIAVAMAGVAFLITRDSAPQDRQIAPVSEPESTATPTPTAEPKPDKPKKPQVDRSKVYVVVFNNSNVAGLAGRVAASATPVSYTHLTLPTNREV